MSVFWLFIFYVFLSVQKVLACGCELDPPPGLNTCNCRVVMTYEENYCQKFVQCNELVSDPGGSYCELGYDIYVHYCQLDFTSITNAKETKINKPNNECGSIIKIENQSLQENLPLIGSDLELIYSSERVLGRASTRKYKQFITQPNDVDVTEVFVVHTVESTPTTYNFSVTNDVEYNYEWNGLNAANNEVIDGVDHLIEVEYEFNNTTRKKIYETKPKIGFYNAKLLGLGGLTFSNHHFYNLKLDTIHYGTGYDRVIEPIKINKIGDVIEKLPIDEPSFTNYLIVSEDGREAYIFDIFGYHLETRSTRTSKILTTFNYDGNKQLTLIEDAFGNEIAVNRPNSTTVEIQTPSGKTTILTLNIDGFAEEVATPNNEIYIMQYSSISGQEGLMTSFEDPKGKISMFVYDGNGNLIEDSNNVGQSLDLNVVYDDPNYKLIEAISAEGRITQYYTSYLDAGESNSSKTKASGAVEIENKQDFYYYLVRPDSYSVTKSRSESPRFGKHTGDDYSTTIYTHGVYHYIYQSDTFTYLDTDLLNLSDHSKILNFDSKDWEIIYDNTTQTYTTTSPLNRIEKVKYNDFDQVVETQTASFSPVEYSYDAQGRLDEITQNTRTWGYVYNAEYEIQSETNPLSETTSYVYDNNGRVIEITYPNTEKTYFEYDEVGNIKKIKAGTKPWHEFLYTLFGSILEYIMPDLGSGSKSVEYAYNNDKQLTKITRENLDEINFTYGTTSGLLENIETVEGDYVYTTDLYTEQLTEIEAPNATKIQYTYLGDVLQIHRVRDGVNNSSYRYDYAKMLPNKRTLRHQDSNSNVSHVTNITYNNDRLMKSIGALTITRTNSTGLISGTSLTGGVNEEYTYDANYGEVFQYKVLHSSTQKYLQQYSRDDLGRTTYAGELNANSTYNSRFYGYDSRGRLRSSGVYNPNEKVYFYDSNSNRIKVEDSNNIEREVGTYNDQDQLLTYVFKDNLGPIYLSYTYTYDDFGNRNSKSESINNILEEYEYDSLGALVSYTKTDLTTTTILKTITYKNDAQGRRLTKTEDGVLQTRYIYDEGIRLVGEVTPDGDTLTHYVYADKSHVPSYMSRSGVNYKFITNEQGSVRHVINASTGALVQDIIYNEFGVIKSDSNPGFQPFGFAGGIYDPDTGLTRFGARDYDAEVGRWTSKDPIRFEGGDTNLYGYVDTVGKPHIETNLYGYSFSDPVNFIDANGLWAVPIAFAIGSYLGITGGFAVYDYVTNPSYRVQKNIQFENFKQKFDPKYNNRQCDPSNGPSNDTMIYNRLIGAN